MTPRLIGSLFLALSVMAAAPALAGPGSLPAYLLPPQDRGEPPYALTGRDHRDERDWTLRPEWSGERAPRLVYRWVRER